MNTRAMIEKSFVDCSFDCSQFWKVIPLQSTLNSSELETAYSEKKQQLLLEGRTEEECEDKILFGCSRTFEEVETISRTGLQVGTKSMNVMLGNVMKGVSLGKNADVFLRSCYKDGLESCWIVVYKVTLGRVKGVLPIQTPPYREPAVEADCHCSFIAPSIDDEPRIQEAKSQVYIYERDVLHRHRPRQCVPFAVAMFTRIDSVMSGVDLTWRREDTDVDTPAGSVVQARLGGLDIVELQQLGIGSVTAAACSEVDAVSRQQNGSPSGLVMTATSTMKGVTPAAAATFENEAVNGCSQQQTSPVDSQSQFASVTSAFLDSLVRSTTAAVNYNQANDPRFRTKQPGPTSEQQQQQPSSQPHVSASESSQTVPAGNSAENPRAQYSHLIRTKSKPTGTDPRSKSNVESAKPAPVDDRSTSVRPPATGNVGLCASNSVPSHIVLLQGQHQLVSDITRQLSADLNTVANFLRATKPENLDAEEVTALRSMQDINAAFQRLTPVCVKYRRFCQSTFDASSTSVLSATSGINLLPDPSCLLRQDVRLRQCRDGLRQIFDYRQRLMMLTVRATEQRTLTFNWLRQHSPSITQCIGWLMQVISEVLDWNGTTAGHPVAAAAVNALITASSTSLKAATTTGSRQTLSEQQTKSTDDDASRSSNFEVRNQQISITSRENISVAHQSQRTATDQTANNVQAACVQALIQQKSHEEVEHRHQQQQAGDLQTNHIPPTSDHVTSLSSPPVALSLVKAERSTTNPTAVTPPRSARPETIIFDADDVPADAGWSQSAALETCVGIQNSLSTVSSNSSFVSELLPPCLTPASVKQDVGDVSDDAAPPVLVPCNQSLTAKQSIDAGKVSVNDVVTGNRVTSSRSTGVALEVGGTDVSSGISGLSIDTNIPEEMNTKLSEPGTDTTFGDESTKRAPTPYPRDVSAEQRDEDEGDTTTAAQNNNNNNNEEEVEEHEEAEDMCKEQLRRLLDARDQKTFSRLLIDSVCSMPADQFSRVREMLIRTLVEKRQQAEAAATVTASGGSSTLMTEEEKLASTSCTGGSAATLSCGSEEGCALSENVSDATDVNRGLGLKIENIFSWNDGDSSIVDSNIAGGTAAAAAVNSHVTKTDTEDSAARMELKWMSLMERDDNVVSSVPCIQNPTGFGSGSGDGANVHNYITIEPTDDILCDTELPVSGSAGGDSKFPAGNEDETFRMSCSPLTRPPRSNVDGGTNNPDDVSQPFRMFMSERQQLQQQPIQPIRPVSPPPLNITDKKIQSTDLGLSVENGRSSPSYGAVSPTAAGELLAADCCHQVFQSESEHLSPNRGSWECVRSPLATRSDNTSVPQLQQLQSVDCVNRSASRESEERMKEQPPHPSWLHSQDERVPPAELFVVRGAAPLRGPPRATDHCQPVYYQSLTMSVSGGRAAELYRNFFAMSKFLRGEEAVRLGAADATRERERLERDAFVRVARSFSDERPNDICTAATHDVKPDADATKPRHVDDDQKRFPVFNDFRSVVSPRNAVSREAGGHGALYSDQRTRRSPVNVSDRRSVRGRRTTGSPDGSSQRPNIIDYRKIYTKSSPNYRGRPYGHGHAPHISRYRAQKFLEDRQFFHRKVHRRVSSRSPGTDGYESDGSGRAFKRARSNNSKMSDSPNRSSRGRSPETNESKQTWQFQSGSVRKSAEMCRAISDKSKTAVRTPPVDVVVGSRQQCDAKFVKSPTLSDAAAAEQHHFYHKSRCERRSTRSTSNGSRRESRDKTREVRSDVHRRKSRSRSASGRRSLSKRDDTVDHRSRQRSRDRTRRRSRSRSSRDYRKREVGKSRSKDRRRSSSERNCRQKEDGGGGSGERSADVEEERGRRRRSRSPSRGSSRRRNVSENSELPGNPACDDGQQVAEDNSNWRDAVECARPTSFSMRSPACISDAPRVPESPAECDKANNGCVVPFVIPTENRVQVAASINAARMTVPSAETISQAEQLSTQSTVTSRRQRSRMQEYIIQLSSDDDNDNYRNNCAPRHEDRTAKILTSLHQISISQQAPTVAPQQQAVATSSTGIRLERPPTNVSSLQQRLRTPLQLTVPTAVNSTNSTTSRPVETSSIPTGPESPIHHRNVVSQVCVRPTAVVRTKTEPELPVADDNEDCISLLSPTNPPSCQSDDTTNVNKTRNFVNPLFTFSRQRNVDQSVRLFSDVATGAASSRSVGGTGSSSSAPGKDRPVVFMVTGLTRKPLTQTSTSQCNGQRDDEAPGAGLP